jgi:hypothetical protein
MVKHYSYEKNNKCNIAYSNVRHIKCRLRPTKAPRTAPAAASTACTKPVTL